DSIKNIISYEKTTDSVEGITGSLSLLLVRKMCTMLQGDEEWDQEPFSDFKWKQKWEAVMSTNFDWADNDVLTKAATPIK
nr:protein phosphatase 2C family protein [Tanacetum cinerariifolium]